MTCSYISKKINPQSFIYKIICLSIHGISFRRSGSSAGFDRFLILLLRDLRRLFFLFVDLITIGFGLSKIFIFFICLSLSFIPIISFFLAITKAMRFGSLVVFVAVSAMQQGCQGLDRNRIGELAIGGFASRLSIDF